jgi:hypothetical protein
VTLTAVVIGCLVAAVGNASTVFTVSTFRDIDVRRELDWALEIPFPVMLLLGGFVGGAGAALAAGLRYRYTAVTQS